MSIILSDFHLSSHLCFCQALGTDFVMCKLEKLIGMACPSDRICLVQPILAGEEHWPCYQLLRGLLPPAHVWRFYLYNPRSCLLGSLILPAGEGKVDLSALLCLFYFLWLCWKKAGWTRDGGDVWRTYYFLWELRGSSSGLWWSSQPCFLHMLSANGTTGRWLLNQNICPEAVGIFFLFAWTQYQSTVSKYFLEKWCKEQRLMFL